MLDQTLDEVRVSLNVVTRHDCHGRNLCKNCSLIVEKIYIYTYTVGCKIKSIIKIFFIVK